MLEETSREAEEKVKREDDLRKQNCMFRGDLDKYARAPQEQLASAYKEALSGGHMRPPNQ